MSELLMMITWSELWLPAVIGLALTFISYTAGFLSAAIPYYLTMRPPKKPRNSERLR